MQLIIFSDIHGNQYTFREFIKQINQIDYDILIFCGDIFGYYYGQKEIIDKLCELKNLVWVKGNHDQYAVNVYNKIEDSNKYKEKYGCSYGYILSDCRRDQINRIRELPDHVILKLQGKKIGVFHGTPEDYTHGRLYPNNLVDLSAVYNEYDYVILGHTHFRMVYKYGHTTIINPGSLGQHRDGKGFGYFIFNLEREEGKFVDIEIDLKQLYKEIDINDKNLTKLKDVLERRPLE
jgi:putative phosphoesterase